MEGLFPTPGSPDHGSSEAKKHTPSWQGRGSGEQGGLDSGLPQDQTFWARKHDWAQTLLINLGPSKAPGHKGRQWPVAEGPWPRPPLRGARSRFSKTSTSRLWPERHNADTRRLSAGPGPARPHYEAYPASEAVATTSRGPAPAPCFPPPAASRLWTLYLSRLITAGITFCACRTFPGTALNPESSRMGGSDNGHLPLKLVSRLDVACL